MCDTRVPEDDSMYDCINETDICIHLKYDQVQNVSGTDVKNLIYFLLRKREKETEKMSKEQIILFGKIIN